MQAGFLLYNAAKSERNLLGHVVAQLADGHTDLLHRVAVTDGHAAVGLDLVEAYDEQHLVDAKGKEDVRTVLHLHSYLAPFKCAVLPLSKKLGDKAMEIRNELAKDFMVDYDDAGSIGKRYRRQDEIGTPLCITVDFQGAV